MSVFRLHKKFFLDLQPLINWYRWGVKEDTQKVHWVGKEKLYRHKLDDGLGFSKLEDFNSMLLAKQVWQLINSKGSIAFKVLKTKYFPNCANLEAKLGHQPGYIRWISTPYSFKVITSKRDEFSLT